MSEHVLLYLQPGVRRVGTVEVVSGCQWRLEIVLLLFMLTFRITVSQLTKASID